MPKFCDKDSSDSDDVSDEEDDDFDKNFGMSDDEEGISVYLNDEDIVIKLRKVVPITEGLSDYSHTSSLETLYPSNCDIDHRDLIK